MEIFFKTHFQSAHPTQSHSRREWDCLLPLKAIIFYKAKEHDTVVKE